ncbi:MAG: hypothetical protein LV479_07660 [Methylacidiphilales bacterium]|nr:hypothetical protein [Candidatus Methylacidiphilales bacterium]
MILGAIMIVLASGFFGSMAWCAPISNAASDVNCCGMTCKCHPDKLGHSSCQVAQAPTGDKSTPARNAQAPATRSLIPLFIVTPVVIPNGFTTATFSRRDFNSSSPPGRSSPQAVLRLWLI